MPLKRMLEKGRVFEPKAVAVLLEAFDAVVAGLELRTVAEKEQAAKIVIRLTIGQENLDSGKLRAGAVALMRNENGPRLRR